MTAKGYTTGTLINAEIGSTISASSTPNITQVNTWIEEAESWIDEKLGTSFTSGSVTNAIIPFNEHNAFKYVHQIPFINSGVDYGRTQYIDSVYLTDENGKKVSPILSVTSLFRNTCTNDSVTDIWESITENTGSAGNFMVDKPSGLVTFNGYYPSLGLTRAIKWSGAYGYSSIPLRIQTLTTKLVTRRILQSGVKKAQFASPHSFSLEGFSSRRELSGNVDYLKELDREIDSLFAELTTNFQSDIAK